MEPISNDNIIKTVTIISDPLISTNCLNKATKIGKEKTRSG